MWGSKSKPLSWQNKVFVKTWSIDAHTVLWHIKTLLVLMIERKKPTAISIQQMLYKLNNKASVWAYTHQSTWDIKKRLKINSSDRSLTLRWVYIHDLYPYQNQTWRKKNVPLIGRRRGCWVWLLGDFVIVVQKPKIGRHTQVLSVHQ